MIAMALITVVFDVIGGLTRKTNLFEISFWNLIIATLRSSSPSSSAR